MNGYLRKDKLQKWHHENMQSAATVSCAYFTARKKTQI